MIRLACVLMAMVMSSGSLERTGQTQPGAPVVLSVSFAVFELANDGTDAAGRERAEAIMRAFTGSPARVLERGDPLFKDLPGAPQTKDAPCPVGVRNISAPQLSVAAGQDASIVVGSPVAYVVPGGSEGCYRIETVPLGEGLEISVRGEIAPGNRVKLAPMTIVLSHVVERIAEGSVPQDLGKPIVKSLKVEAPLTLGESQYAVLALPQQDGVKPLGMMVWAQAVDAAK